MTALHCDPLALAGILHERQGDYEFAARGTVKYYERVLDLGAWLTGLKDACAHGVWMKALKAAGWSYSICNRAMKLHRLGVSAAELALEGAKGVLKRFARPRRPAEDDEAKFSAGAKFDPAGEPLPGAEATGLEPFESGSTAKFKPPPTASEPGEAPALESGDEETTDPCLALPEGEGEAEADVGPLLGEGYDHGKPGHRMVYALTTPGLKGLERAVLALHAFRDGGRGSFLTNPVLAHYLRCSKDRIKQCHRNLKAMGLLDNTLHRNQPIHWAFPDGPSEPRQRELTLLRTFEGGKQAHPRREAGSPPGVSPDPAWREVDFPQNRKGNGTGNRTSGGRGNHAQQQVASFLAALRLEEDE